MMDYATMADVRAANEALGHHFFEADTMRFFDSRVESKLYGGKYFITSEQFEFRGEKSPRRYTLRRVEPDGEIATVFGQFQEHATITDAVAAAEKAERGRARSHR